MVHVAAITGTGAGRRQQLDLFVDAHPFRLLLAHTSARNFLAYEARLRQRGHTLDDRLHRITVINRGSWGELRFSLRD